MSGTVRKRAVQKAICMMASFDYSYPNPSRVMKFKPLFVIKRWVMAQGVPSVDRRDWG